MAGIVIRISVRSRRSRCRQVIPPCVLRGSGAPPARFLPALLVSPPSPSPAPLPAAGALAPPAVPPGSAATVARAFTLCSPCRAPDPGRRAPCARRPLTSRTYASVAGAVLVENVLVPVAQLVAAALLPGVHRVLD